MVKLRDGAIVEGVDLTHDRGGQMMVEPRLDEGVDLDIDLVAVRPIVGWIHVLEVEGIADRVRQVRGAVEEHSEEGISGAVRAIDLVDHGVGQRARADVLGDPLDLFFAVQLRLNLGYLPEQHNQRNQYQFPFPCFFI
mgnify:CR=1 FL=1